MSCTHQIRSIEGQACPPCVIIAVETKEDMFKVSVVLIKCSEVPIPVDMYVCSRNYTLGVLEWITIRNDSQSKDVLDSPYTVPLFPMFIWSHTGVVRPSVDMIVFSETVISFNLIHGGSQVPDRKG
jgi:hypothetical protein